MAVMADLGGLLPAVLDVGVRGALLLAAAGILTLVARRRSAALRHLIWALAVGGLLALPAVRAVAPDVRVDLAIPAALAVQGYLASPVDVASSLAEPAGPVRSGPSGASVPAPPDASMAVAGSGGPPAVSGGTRAVRPAEVAEASTRAAAVPASGETGSGLPLATWLTLVWLAGVAVLLAPVAVGWVGLRRLARRSRPLASSRIRHRATRLALRVGVTRSFGLVEGPAGTMPMTFGLARPVIVLPPGASDWDASRLDAVLLHELAHVGRRDTLTQLLAELARAIHWFNPLVWVAARRLRVEREHACDDVALAGGARPSDYADQLLGLARSFRSGPGTGRVALAMARPSQLSDRLLAVLDEGRSRGDLGRATTLRAVGLALGLVLPLAVMTPAAADAVRDDEEREVAAVQEATCAAASGEWRSVSHESNNRRLTIRMQRPGCELEARLEGDVTLDAAGIGVEQMGRNARVQLEEDDGRQTRYLEIYPGSDGRPEFDYRVDRRSHAFDSAAQAWYRAFLLQLFRNTGWFAEQRVDALLASGGVESVFREMGRIDASHAYGRYAELLLERAPLDEAQVRALVRSTASRGDSDYALAGVLGAVADHQRLTGGLLDDYIQATLSLDSDHYRAQALRRVLGSGQLSDAQVETVLHASTGMDSDHYRTEVLRSVADRYALKPAFRQTYIEATSSMDSDHYRTEVLTRLLSRSDLTAAEKAAVLEATAMVHSDHYRSEILRQVGQRGLDDAALHTAFFRVAAGLDSDHYYRQTMAVLLTEAIGGDLLVEVIESAARQLDSDHYLSDLLLHVLDSQAVEGPVRAALLGAMDTLDSSHYRGRVADALLRAERR